MLPFFMLNPRSFADNVDVSTLAHPQQPRRQPAEYRSADGESKLEGEGDVRDG